MKRITYRRLTKKDVAAVEELENECFSDPWTRAMLLGAFCSEFFVGFGAFSGKTLAGFAIGTSVFEDAETDDIAVRESFRRQGIGGELLRLLEETAKERGAARAYLEVRVSNAAAIALYESRGYRKLHVRKRYYPDGEDAYAMSKRLLPDGAAEMRSAETGSL